MSKRGISTYEEVVTKCVRTPYKNETRGNKLRHGVHQTIHKCRTYIANSYRAQKLKALSKSPLLPI